MAVFGKSGRFYNVEVMQAVPTMYELCMLLLRLTLSKAVWVAFLLDVKTASHLKNIYQQAWGTIV